MNVRTFINILIILVGPAATFWFYMESKNWTGDWRVYLLLISIFSIITIAVAVMVNRKTSKGSVIKSLIFSIATYIILMCSVIYLYDPSGIGWLLVIIPFMVIYTFPMAFSVSLGTIRILEDMKAYKDRITKKEAG